MINKQALILIISTDASVPPGKIINMKWAVFLFLFLLSLLLLLLLFNSLPYKTFPLREEAVSIPAIFLQLQMVSLLHDMNVVIVLNEMLDFLKHISAFFLCWVYSHAINFCFFRDGFFFCAPSSSSGLEQSVPFQWGSSQCGRGSSRVDRELCKFAGHLRCCVHPDVLSA